LATVLAFRNTSSYARWWEARGLWGQIVNGSRNLARQALSMIASSNGDEATGLETPRMRRRIVMLQIAYVHALRCHLRGLSP
jgi:putative membrane protein